MCSKKLKIRIHFQNITKHQKQNWSKRNSSGFSAKNIGFLRKIQVIYRFYEKNKGFIGLTQNYRLL